MTRTRAADVVLPVAPAVEKAGTFVSWEGRLRPFDAVLSAPGTLTDIRVLAGIAEEMGSSLGFRTTLAASYLLTSMSKACGNVGRPFRSYCLNRPAQSCGPTLKLPILPSFHA